MGHRVVEMAFVRCGGREIAYGRGDRDRTSWEHKMRYEERTTPQKRVVITQVGDPDAPYLAEISELNGDNAAIQKNIDGCGPQDPEVIIADRLCQGPAAVFVRDKATKSWLPLAHPNGSARCFAHKGLVETTDMSQYSLADQ